MSQNKFVIFSTQRTGSTLLCEKLTAVESCLCHYELFNENMVGVNNKKKNTLTGITLDIRNNNLETFYQKIFNDDIHTVGFKIFYNHSPWAISRLLFDTSVKKIILKRDLLSAYVSTQQAILSKSWLSTQGNSHIYNNPINIDLCDFDMYCSKVMFYFNFIERFCNETKQDFFTLFYYDVVQKGRLKNVLAWLGLDYSESIESHQLSKQGAKNLADRIANYDAVCEHCKKYYPDSLILR